MRQRPLVRGPIGYEELVSNALLVLFKLVASNRLSVTQDAAVECICEANRWSQTQLSTWSISHRRLQHKAHQERGGTAGRGGGVDRGAIIVS